jgi:hypothetical protein
MDNETKNEVKKQDRRPNPFKVLNALAMMSKTPERIPALVDNLLLETGVSMLVAKPKTGKSTLALQLSVAVAEGTDFFDKSTLHGDVLYLALEGQQIVVWQNMKKLGYTGKRGIVHVVHGHTPWDGEEGLTRLEDTIVSLPKLKLIVLDPAAKLLRLLDSYEPGEVGKAIEKLEILAKKYSLHIMFLVHAKKKVSDDAGDAAMGSTSFRGGSDTNVFLVKKGEQRIISAEQRWCDPLEPTLLIHDKKTNSSRLGVTAEVEEEAQRERKDHKNLERIEKQIFDALLDEELTTRELLEKVTGKNTTILTVRDQMVGSGRIVAEQDGSATRYRAVEIPTEAEKRAA